MNSYSTVEKIADKAEVATDKMADKAERSVESARLYANEALDKADAKVRSLREDVKPAIDARMPMSELKAAYARMNSRKVMGKLVLVND